MLIRLATKTDIPQILQLINEVVPALTAEGNFQWDDGYPNAEVFENDIALNELWVADADGAIAAVSAITTDQEPEYAMANWDVNETAVVVHRLAVTPRYRGKGIANKLLLQAEQVAHNQGIKTMRIDTNVVNTAAQQLFLRAGYVYVGEIGLNFRPGMRFYCYEKRLY